MCLLSFHSVPCRHLLTLINDIMDYSKLVAGQLKLHHERIRVQTLLQVRGPCDASRLRPILCIF